MQQNEPPREARLGCELVEQVKHCLGVKGKLPLLPLPPPPPPSEALESIRFPSLLTTCYQHGG